MNVQFPLESLDLSQYGTFKEAPQPFHPPLTAPNRRCHALQDPPPVYDLYAVANHIGQSGHGGHYTAFCKNYDSRPTPNPYPTPTPKP